MLILSLFDLYRVPEAILIAMVTTVCIYLATVILGTCVQFSNVEQNTCSVGKFLFQCMQKLVSSVYRYMQIMNNLRNETRDYLCPDQEYYNDMATLMFNPHETVIKLLFHHNGSAEAIFS